MVRPPRLPAGRRRLQVPPPTHQPLPVLPNQASRLERPLAALRRVARRLVARRLARHHRARHPRREVCRVVPTCLPNWPESRRARSTKRPKPPSTAFTVSARTSPTRPLATRGTAVTTSHRRTTRWRLFGPLTPTTSVVKVNRTA